MHDMLDALLARLDVAPQGGGVFRGELEQDEDAHMDRAFGGELVGQAVVAAGRTAPGRHLHSLHAYFLRAGRSHPPVLHHVERVRDGRTFSSRRVRISQDGRVLCEAAISFTSQADGVAFQDDQMPDVPPPEALPDEHELAVAEGQPPPPPWPFVWRHVEVPWRPPAEGEHAGWRVWMRPRRPLPDDPLLHAALIAYYSDAGAFGAIERRFGEFDWGRSASLDHALWLHQDVRWEDWLLVTTESPVARASRALTHRRYYTRDGALVATVVQEAVFRPAREQSADA